MPPAQLVLKRSRFASLVIELLHKETPGSFRLGVSFDPRQGEGAMATDAEIEAAVRAMRTIRVVGGKIHDDVLCAYARAALEAGQRIVIEGVRKRIELRQHLSTGAPPPG
jgi:hypothetical protein